MILISLILKIVIRATRSYKTWSNEIMILISLILKLAIIPRRNFEEIDGYK
jgi:hypothetical protein